MDLFLLWRIAHGYKHMQAFYPWGGLVTIQHAWSARFVGKMFDICDASCVHSAWKVFTMLEVYILWHVYMCDVWWCLMCVTKEVCLRVVYAVLIMRGLACSHMRIRRAAMQNRMCALWCGVMFGVSVWHDFMQTCNMYDISIDMVRLRAKVGARTQLFGGLGDGVTDLVGWSEAS